MSAEDGTHGPPANSPKLAVTTATGNIRWPSRTTRWDTEDELIWLEDLGFHGKKAAELPEEEFVEYRCRLLRSYIETAPSRRIWGGINATVCIERAKEIIAEEKAVAEAAAAQEP